MEVTFLLQSRVILQLILNFFQVGKRKQTVWNGKIQNPETCSQSPPPALYSVMKIINHEEMMQSGVRPGPASLPCMLTVSKSGLDFGPPGGTQKCRQLRVNPPGWAVGVHLVWIVAHTKHSYVGSVGLVWVEMVCFENACLSRGSQQGGRSLCPINGAAWLHPGLKWPDVFLSLSDATSADVSVTSWCKPFWSL